MLKRISVLILLLYAGYAKAQTDTATSPLDKLTPEELIQYYIDEPEPFSKFRGPEKVGDSLYGDLNTQVIPTQTVEAKGLYHEGVSEAVDSTGADSAFVSTAQAMKPKVSLGAGRLGFYGDLYSKNFQSPLTARWGFDLNLSQRLTRYLQLNFNVMFGKLGANERSLYHNSNFISEIRAGGVNLMYDFGNFISDKYIVRPYFTVGVSGFEFLSKTDILDANGNAYHYWSDGSIKNMPETASGSQYAVDLKRDYVYETDVRESNVSLFGKYPERSFSTVYGAGIVMKVTERVDMKFNFQMYITATDYIDGLTKQNGGNKHKDKFTYSSVSLQYDLIAKPLKIKKKKKPVVDPSTIDWLALDKSDYDKDGVDDMKDNCQGTPKDIKVNSDGCPEDSDGDGIEDFRDDEINTPKGMVVDTKGVASSDEYWKKWYDQYMNDSTDANMTTEYIGNTFALKSNKPKFDPDKEVYTVELARYEGAIPSDEMAFLLSIGDINSTTLDNGTTVVYTSGRFKKVKNVLKAREEFVKMGNANAGISKLKGKNITRLSEEEVQKLLAAETKAMEDLKAGSDSTSIANANIENVASEGFGPDDIVYRVQLGAFKNKISSSVFNTSAGVLELKSGEGVYRYVTKGYRTIDDAAQVRADLVIQGYSDAFVTAYKGGKRIPMNQTQAKVEKGYKEDLNENKMFSSVNKKLVLFKIQLGPNKRPTQVAAADEKYKDLKNLEKQSTTTGNIRFTTGSFPGYDAAEKYRKELEGKGFSDAFIIATFKDELISIQEALELLK
ncbi:MAG: hypothetical protein KBG47_05990 [Bacteroidia bacterium]|nr:hypothetical protein [Bacteroidia bacterium]